MDFFHNLFHVVLILQKGQQRKLDDPAEHLIDLLIDLRITLISRDCIS